MTGMQSPLCHTMKFICEFKSAKELLEYARSFLYYIIVFSCSHDAG
jgi:hypothetical protein